MSAFLCSRDFVERGSSTSALEGVVVAEPAYLAGRRLFAAVVLIYRYGHEDLEVMGVKLHKEFCLVNEEVGQSQGRLSQLQERLMAKLGPYALPVTVVIPQNAPCSVLVEGFNPNPKVTQPGRQGMEFSGFNEKSF